MSTKIGRNDACSCGSGKKAKHCCLRLADPDADIARSYYNRGTDLQAAGRVTEAIGQFRAALALQPDHVEAHVNLGNALQAQGEVEAALGCYRRALNLRPQFHELHLNIGAALQALGRFDEAIASYLAALTRRDGDARLHNNLAIVLRECGRLDEAEASFRRAAQRAPGVAVIEHGLAGLLLSRGRTAEAQLHYRSALASAPGDADILHGLADALHDGGQFAEAAATLREALAAGPATAKSWSGLLMKSLYSSELPMRQLWRDHRRFAERFEVPLRTQLRPHANSPDPHRRLRVGYVSADLRSHSVAYFLEPVLARHDRLAFEVHCYYTAENSDGVTARLRALADGWVEAARLSDEELAQRVRADGMDILVDLSGHTAGNRLLAFARRPAPVQVSWIGYPSASGLDQIEYFLTDAIASPPGCAQFRDDAADAPGLLRLPRVFSVYRPPPFAPAPLRAQRGGDGGVVLGSFNNAAKISDATVRLWSRLLLADPGMRLLLKDRRFGDAQFRAATVGRFAAAGVAAERLELLERASADADHLAQYGRIDIALDTYPYCGVTTTCEALWMGVPVVSLAGDSFVARMGATLLSAVGRPEWVALDEDGYVARVLALAHDPALRTELRGVLRAQMAASPLTDEDGYTRELEGAYRHMWQNWCARP